MEIRVAYIVNHYPSVSHSFIRREIAALESQGVVVQRIALRGWDSEVVDEQDVQERGRTQYVMRGGFLGLLWAIMACVACRPLRFLSALKLATRMGLRSDRSMPYHWIYLAEACVAMRWAAKFGARHLHAHFGTNSAEVAMLTGVLGELKYSFTAHGSEETDRAAYIGLGEKIRRASFVVSVSSFGRSQLFRRVGHKYWDKIHVVHCGLDAAFYQDAPEESVCGPRLVCVGRLSEQKGQLLLLAALRELLDDALQCELVLAGDGEMRSLIESRIVELQLQSHVRVTGWISSAQVRTEILGARALVLPSFVEGLPVVIMEALALRRPVISTYVAGIPELVEHGRSGWLVPAGDVRALAFAMRECLAAPQTRLNSMGEIGRRQVLMAHDVGVEAGRLRALFIAAIGD